MRLPQRFERSTTLSAKLTRRRWEIVYDYFLSLPGLARSPAHARGSLRQDRVSEHPIEPASFKSIVRVGSTDRQATPYEL